MSDAIHFVSIQPDFIRAYLSFGIFRAAEDHQPGQFHVHNLRNFATDKHGTIDGRPYGGGDGMVFRPEPLAKLVQSFPEKPYVIHFSPSGKPFKQADSLRLSAINRPLLMVCSRFGGLDQRFIDHYVDEEISLGDFVISGGELAALTVADAIVRHRPGALGHQDSAKDDSFSEGMNGALEHPLYTRPEIFEGVAVPEVLLSGHHVKIEQWKREQSEIRTLHRRPDLIPEKK